MSTDPATRQGVQAARLLTCLMFFTFAMTTDAVGMATRLPVPAPVQQR